MEWAVVYHGFLELEGLDVESDESANDLREEAIEASRKIVRKKSTREPMVLSIDADLGALVDQQKAFYQPVLNIIYSVPHAEGPFKKTHFFTFIATVDGYRAGAPGAKYQCHTFKVKADGDTDSLAFAIGRTKVVNQRKKPSKPLAEMNADEREAAVAWWNSHQTRMFHFSLSKDGTISGNMKFQCQVDASLRTVTKIVRLSNLVHGDELIKLLAEKFNLGDVDLSLFAIFDHQVMSNDQSMLEDDASPISMALRWSNPFDGTFWLRKLPQGLVRVAAVRPGGVNTQAQAQASNGHNAGSVAESTGTQGMLSNRSSSSGADQAAPTPTSQASPAKAEAVPDANSSATPPQEVHASAEQNQSLLGPLLPYHPDDEDLLLSVMIARQSGTGLGFKLTPAYLLQMCIAYCSLHRGEEALEALLRKISSQIRKVIVENPTNPDMLLFWASNTLKLDESLQQDPAVYAVVKGTVKEEMDTTVEVALKKIRQCAAQSAPLPSVLEQAEWSSLGELRTVVIQYYRSLDSNMSHASLQEVVQRITAAMPSPTKAAASAASAESTRSAAPYEEARTPPRDNTANLTLQLQDGLALTTGSLTDLPLTSTPMVKQHRRSIDGSAAGGGGDGGASGSDGGDGRQSRPGIEPLPDEWEELVDQETKHRFFANHVTRETSWTDPRDRLVTVTLVKGKTGLGLGISGAKRTWDDRLLLGIFVSSLVPGSGAAMEGTLREGDEILEVNGHSLIGVNREGAIEFLKQVQGGDQVVLLVAQEPDAVTGSGATDAGQGAASRESMSSADGKAALRHTAL